LTFGEALEWISGACLVAAPLAPTWRLSVALVAATGCLFYLAQCYSATPTGFGKLLAAVGRRRAVRRARKAAAAEAKG
jgi:hypothetical protein